MRTIENPTVDETGDEHHPSFGVVTVTKSQGTPKPLFQSDLLHSTAITLRVESATRNRSLGKDWVLGRESVVEIEMSLAQWAAVVSSIGDGGGTPVTLRHTQRNGRIPDAPYKPRTESARAEVTGHVDKLLAELRTALDELDAAEDAKASVKERRAARDKLRMTLSNASLNAEFATRSMEQAVEKTVQQARADIETIIAQAAERHGVTGTPIALPSMANDPLAITAQDTPRN